MEARGDFLVIGSGIAGLRAALSLADAGDVVILTKADPRESNTGYAQGGIAAAIGADDSPELHARDTLAAGGGLCVRDAVDLLAREGPRYVAELLEWGALFDREADGRPALGREGAHSVRRVLHARDATGREIARLLWTRVSGNRQIHVVDDALATECTTRDGRCSGAAFVSADNTPGIAIADRTLLATGGAGQVFRETTNPAIATGDGIAMAARAGARVADLEFVQFHPTVLSVQGAPRFLLSEALRGEGARLINNVGERFMERYEPAGELASRDLVSRAMVREAERTGAPICLSLAHLAPDFVRTRFPTIARVCSAAGLDLARDPIPVSPAAHYIMGGVETDLDGRTSLPGLFAAGEVACSGVHGANRLASNSLLEGLVFGARAASAMKVGLQPAELSASDVVDRAWGSPASDAQGGPIPSAPEVRDLMWRHVGVLRHHTALEAAVAQLHAWVGAVAAHHRTNAPDQETRRTESLVTAGLLIASAALRRTESRGAHFRTDFPLRDDLHWKKRVAERMHGH